MSLAVQGILESEAYAVLTAGDGLAALEIMTRTVPDLILADIVMPRMDGYRFYERVRARPDWIPIPFIFLTGRSEQKDQLRGIELGAEDYITKPFTAEELIVSVRSRLGRARVIEKAREAKFEKLREQIITILAHELRTPLTHVTGYTDLALEDFSSLTAAEVEEFLKRIKSGADRLKQLVEDLLLLLRIDTGQARDECESLAYACRNLGAIVRRTVAGYAKRAAELDLSLHVSTEPGLPPVRLCESFFVDALGRLIENGMKFTRTRGGKVKVQATAEAQWVRISISDNGVGIPTEQQEYLFEPFGQLNREEMEQQGTGLGLVLAQKLVALHGGQIVMQSTPGQGSTFTILIPRAVGPY